VYYSKDGPARFIGHLDLQSLFSKALKRAGLPVAYSQGFNPHQLLSVALPLPLGMAGFCELFEIYLTTEVNITDMTKSLNEQMPQGLKILEIQEVSALGKSAAALVHAAIYSIEFPGEIKYEATLDGIIDIKILNTNCIEATLAAGSKKNLKPQIFAPGAIKHERKGLLL
jgi:radical SAM-linked protein